jgi:hypothetical protein
MARSPSPHCRTHGRRPVETGGLRATPGTRVTYRVRGHGHFKPIEKFIASAQAHLQERYEHYTRLYHNTPDTAWEKRWYERMCHDLTEALRTLASPHIGREALSALVHKVYGGTSDYPPDMARYAKGMRLFAELEFRQEPSSSGEPLGHLPPATACCRITDRGDPVLLEQTPPVPQATERPRPLLLAEHQPRHADLARQNAAEREEPSPASQTHPTTRQGAEPPQDKVIPLFPKRPRYNTPKKEEEVGN